MLRELGQGAHVIDHRLSLAGLQIGARTSLLRLRDGGLLLISPGRMDDAVRAQVEGLGPVRALAAPNRFHHLFLGQASRAWPEAKVLMPPTLQEKLKAAGRDLAPHAVLGDEPPEVLEGSVLTHRVKGIPKMEEVAFFHPASRTLVLTDLCFNFQKLEGLWTRVALTLYGAGGRFGPTYLERFLMKDKKAVRRSVDHLLSWDFDRVIVSHGDVLETGGHAALKESFTWLRP